MKVILNFEEDRYKVTVITGRKVFKTNNIENVASIIADIPSNPTFALPYKDDLKLFYGLDKQLVLKDYKKNLNEEYFKFICDGIDQKTHIVKSLSKTNKKRIAAHPVPGTARYHYLHRKQKRRAFGFQFGRGGNHHRPALRIQHA